MLRFLYFYRKTAAAVDGESLLSFYTFINMHPAVSRFDKFLASTNRLVNFLFLSQKRPHLFSLSSTSNNFLTRCDSPLFLLTFVWLFVAFSLCYLTDYSK